jgi:hypothetical protein
MECPPKNSLLETSFGGWQKYSVFEINGKNCKLDNTQYIVLNILHLLNPFKVDDIVIFRILKKNKDDDKYSVRYVCKQGNKQNVCANIKQLNDHIIKKCEYSGRLLTPKDFKINNVKNENTETSVETENNKLPL